MSRRSCREFVELMRKDPHLGVKIGDEIMNIAGQYGKYLIIDRRNGEQLQVTTTYITDFVQEIYDSHEAKAVRICG